jgi:hypothetical protein
VISTPLLPRLCVKAPEHHPFSGTNIQYTLLTPLDPYLPDRVRSRHPNGREHLAREEPRRPIALVVVLVTAPELALWVSEAEGVDLRARFGHNAGLGVCKAEGTGVFRPRIFTGECCRLLDTCTFRGGF